MELGKKQPSKSIAVTCRRIPVAMDLANNQPLFRSNSRRENNLSTTDHFVLRLVLTTESLETGLTSVRRFTTATNKQNTYQVYHLLT